MTFNDEGNAPEPMEPFIQLMCAAGHNTELPYTDARNPKECGTASYSPGASDELPADRTYKRPSAESRPRASPPFSLCDAGSRCP